MRIKDYFTLAAMAVLGLFGLVMVLGALLNAADEESTSSLTELLSLGLGLGLLPLGISIWLTRSVIRGASHRRRESIERHVLHLAAEAGGELTPAQVAQSTHLTLAESKKFLNQLGLNGHCRMQIDDDGVISYKFSN